jgi:hypothetical protein
MCRVRKRRNIPSPLANKRWLIAQVRCCCQPRAHPRSISLADCIGDRHYLVGIMLATAGPSAQQLPQSWHCQVGSAPAMCFLWRPGTTRSHQACDGQASTLGGKRNVSGVTDCCASIHALRHFSGTATACQDDVRGHAVVSCLLAPCSTFNTCLGLWVQSPCVGSA